MGLPSISLDWGKKMALLSLHHQPLFSSLPHKPSRCSLDATKFYYTPSKSSVTRRGDDGCSASSPLSTPLLRFGLRVSIGEAERHREWGDARGAVLGSEDLGEESQVFKKTLRLVECAMFASVSGLAYFLSNSLAVEVTLVRCLWIFIVVLVNVFLLGFGFSCGSVYLRWEGFCFHQFSTLKMINLLFFIFVLLSIANGYNMFSM